MDNHFDIAIIGGGIVGLATAYKLQIKYPNSIIVLFEKEKKIATHQTGNNSGVIHSGLYYEPGSKKSRIV
jgi:L-2-hydroxyglutarate oxidase